MHVLSEVSFQNSTKSLTENSENYFVVMQNIWLICGQIEKYVIKKEKSQNNHICLISLVSNSVYTANVVNAVSCAMFV